MAWATLLLCLSAQCGAPASGDAPDGIAAVLGAFPGLSPRLSVAAPFRRCTERVPEGGTIPRADCPAPPSAQRHTDAGIKPGADDPRSVQLRALLDLVAEDPRGIALDRAITSLRRVIELSDDPTPALVDLSAALIVRAERMQTPRDLLEAYETAQKATDRQPHDAAALYNRALALDRFGLVEETAEDWKLAIAADSASEWAAEARRRLTALQSIHAPIPPRDDAPLTDYARYAAEDPQGARELGMDKLLPAWGDAVLRGETATAADRLRRAEALGTALLRRRGGDGSLADMVMAIRSTGTNTVATRELAEAHHDYGKARRSYGTLDLAGVADALTRPRISESPLSSWARLYTAITILQLGGGGGVTILDEVARSDSMRYPALIASAQWALGRTQTQREKWESALAHMDGAAALFRKAGEGQNEAGALGILADSHLVLGEADPGYVALHRASRLLQPYRASRSLHNVLVAATGAAATDGFGAAAIRLASEDVSVASRLANPAITAEARLERARQLTSRSQWRRASDDIVQARRIVAATRDRRTRNWFEADLREAEAILSMRNDPDRASSALDSAAAYFFRVPLPFRVLPALVAAAEARLRVGDAPGAIIRLEEVLRILGNRRDSIRVEPRRAAIFDAARSTVDRIVTLKLAEGQPGSALGYLDRARAAFAPAGRRPATGDRSSISVPPGEVALSYARIGDTVYIWALRGDHVDVARIRVDTITLVRTLSKLERDLEARAPAEAVRPALAQLYNTLVKPVESVIAQEQLVVIAADGELAATPFAALYNTTSGQYLVEDHVVSHTVSLDGSTVGKVVLGGERALLVSDPAFNIRAHSLLDRLANARTEVDQVAAGYPGATVLTGAAATRSAFLSGLPSATLVHFAGHAVFDDLRPERSYLLLAEGDGTGTLTAAEIARLELPRTRLVVLSACRTVRGGHTRAGGFTGLSGAFLAAGVEGVVGTMWNVDDNATARLIPEFYRTYRTRRDAAAAVRAAQLTLIRSGDPELESPSSWAGFRFIGRR